MSIILILSGSLEALNAIVVAKDMGLRVIVCDGDARAPGRRLADDFINASIYHPKKILEALSVYRDKSLISAVIAVAADIPASVSAVANYLGLEGLNKETSELSTHKLKMKTILKDKGISMPWFKGIESLSDLIEIVQTRPCLYVLKPVDSRGSRGVIRIERSSECEHAFQNSVKHSPSKKLILEEWIDGDQLSSESVVWNSKSYLCGLADRNYSRLDELYPFVVEDGGETPSKHSSTKLEKEINSLMDKVCGLIGLHKGSIKGDLILNGGNVYLIEFASRLSGGYFSTLTIPLVYDYNLIENVIQIALGKIPKLPPHPLKVNKYQANRFCFIQKGQIDSISGLPLENPNIVDFKLFVKQGDVIDNITDHTLRAGTVLTTGNSTEEAVRLAENTIMDLNFKLV
jgi:biotin carboxylase